LKKGMLIQATIESIKSTTNINNISKLNVKLERMNN